MVCEEHQSAGSVSVPFHRQRGSPFLSRPGLRRVPGAARPCVTSPFFDYGRNYGVSVGRDSDRDPLSLARMAHAKIEWAAGTDRVEMKQCRCIRMLSSNLPMLSAMLG